MVETRKYRPIPRGFACPTPFLQVVRWLMREKVCNGDRASAVRLGQDMVSHRLLAPVCAGYHRPEEEFTGGGGDSSSGKEQGELLRSFDDAVGWLFAFVGDALRDPFAPPPPTQVAVMSNTGVDVRVTGWTEVSVETRGGYQGSWYQRCSEVPRGGRCPATVERWLSAARTVFDVRRSDDMYNPHDGSGPLPRAVR